jgi:hypothetical protein
MSKSKCPETESLDELIAIMDAQINRSAKGAKKPAAQLPKQGETQEG